MKQHKKTRKRVAIWSILLLQATSFLYDNSYGWSYPLKEVSTLECKKYTWEEMPNNCKQALPRIINANYEKYKNDTNYTLIYSTLRGATYTNGWDAGLGSHEGVDIATSRGTPVYAMGDGEIVRAGAQGGYGNVVMIKHIWNGKPLYSIYGHLHTVNTTIGEKVKEGQLIGTVGNEGFSFGNHLIWNINISPNNTYVFWGCPEYGNGLTWNALENVVNRGLCRSYLTERSIDPIAFIENNGRIISTTSTNTTKTITNAGSVTVRRPIIPLAPLIPLAPPSTVIANKDESASTKTPTKTPTKPLTEANTHDTNTSFIPPQAGTSFSSATLKLNDSFLQKHTITVTSNFGNVLNKGETSTISITVTDSQGKNYQGVLPEEIVVTPSKQNVLISPRVIRNISQGKIISFVSANDTGSTDLVVSYGNIVLGKITVHIK